MEPLNYVAKLNEHAHSAHLELKYEEVGSVGPDHIKTFTLRAVLNGKAYPDGAGKNKKEAKQNAAKNALKGLLEEPVNSTGDEQTSVAPSQPVEESDQNVSDVCDKTKSLTVTRKGKVFREINFIGLVNHYCQKKRILHDYILQKKCGPPHNPQFFYRLVIDNKVYPVGEGTNIKEAKQHAAQLAWSSLQEQSDWDSKVSVRSTVSEDGAPPVSAQSPTQECLASSQSTSTGTSRSGTVTNSSKTSEDQHAVTDRNMGNSHNEFQSAQSRFTSDFDSIKRIGKGSFSYVFKAKEKLTQRDYAIKIVHCEDIRKDLREVGALSDLQHHNIVRYYTCWLEDSGYQGDSADGSCSTSQSTDTSSAKNLYIKLELCDIKTLRVWIDEKNTQSLQDSERREESLSIVKQILSGVEYIHSKKHIHRDLKPANILFGLDGVVKIGDFGLVTRDDGALVDRTVNKGTPIYRAPEQKSEKNYDRKVDIFPLGLIYLELLWKVSTGREKGAIIKVLDDARSQKFPAGFSRTFPQEDQIIQSMLCEKPEGRPEASTLKAELEKCTQTFKAQNVCPENEICLL